MQVLKKINSAYDSLKSFFKNWLKKVLEFPAKYIC